MRRPLLMVALCLVVVAAIRLGLGKEEPAGAEAWENIDAGSVLTVMGQVYQKEGKTVYLQKITLLEEWNEIRSPDDLVRERQVSLRDNMICELQEEESLEQIPMGSMVVIEGTFAPFSKATNPGEFDQKAYYRILQIGGRLRKAELLARGQGCWPVQEGLSGLRQCLHKRLYQIFPQKEAAVMCALLLGEKSELDGEQKALYKRSGILHIFSISSLHITIIGMSVYKILRRLRIPVWAAATAGSLILLGYGCLAGFGVSACRAIGMYLIRMLGEVLGRTYDLPTALGFLAAVMVWKNPLYLQHSGFLLSFASVSGIVAVAPALFEKKAKAPADSDRNRKRIRIFLEKIAEGLRQSAAASLSITLATLPVQLWFYYEVPVYAVGVNLLILPFMKPLMFLGILALVPGLGYLSQAGRLILLWYETLCNVCGRLPFASWNPGRPGLIQVCGYYLVLGIVVLVKRRRGRGRMLSWAVLTGIVLFLGVRGPGQNKVTFLDVGQGDCILVQTASGETYLFDCGSSSRSKVGQYVLLPFLKFYGIHRIDAIFLSHPDADHVNGARELLAMGEENGIRIGQLVLPDIEEESRDEQFGDLFTAAARHTGTAKSVPVRYLGAGDTWNCKSASFTCLHPASGYSSADKNAYSSCVYVEFLGKSGGKSGQTLLLTGDVEAEGEEALTQELARRKIWNVTILKAAHHGSAGSTSQTFLEQIHPQAVVISCGRDNRYGHPHEEMLGRLEEAGCLVLRTDMAGAVTAYFVRDGVKIDTYGK